MMNNIKQIRKDQGLTQGDLGRRIGLTAATVSRLEEGKRKLSQQHLLDIARALNVGTSDILGAELRGLAPSSLVPIRESVGANEWRVPDLTKPEYIDTVPCIMPPKYKNISGTARVVSDDHLGEVAPKGSYLITVPFDGLRKTPAIGDIVLVRETEGRMERLFAATHEEGMAANAVMYGGDQYARGGNVAFTELVIAVYRELL